MGATAFERRATPCEYAAGLLVAPDLLVTEDKGGVIVFPDLSEHVLFRDHVLVTEVPHGKRIAHFIPRYSPSTHVNRTRGCDNYKVLVRSTCPAVEWSGPTQKFRPTY